MTFSLANWIKTLDVRVRIPRRMDQQYVSSNRAFFVFSQTLGHCAVFFAAAAFASFVLIYSCLHVGIPTFNWVLVVLGIVVLFGSAVSETSAAFLPFSTFTQSEVHGRARWATRADLVGQKLLRKVGEYSRPPQVGIASFGLRHELALPVEKMLQHVIVHGPTGSGKTQAVVIPICRQWLSEVGSVVSVSAKSDVAEFVGLYTRPENVYILDLADATRSDRIDLFTPARFDQAYAQAIAAMMVRSHADKSSSASQFFESASTALVKALILYLTHNIRQVTIDDLYSLLSRAGVKADANDNEKEHVFQTLDSLMLSSGIREIVEQFRLFSNVEKETKWNIIISLSTRLEAFRATQDIRVILTPPDQRESLSGIKLLDLSKLREPGTALFIIIDEAQAKSLQNVVPTILGTIMMYLRQTGSESESVTPCLIAIDEAGQYYVDQLLADITLGRSRQTSLLLCFQSYEQIVDLYGATNASGIFECALTKVFLPGLAGVTAKKVSETLGHTTAVQIAKRDNRNDAFDGVQGSEIKRELMTPDEVRQMTPFQEMLVIHGHCPPIRASFPPAAVDMDNRRMPLNVYDVTHPDLRPSSPIEAILAREGGSSAVSGGPVPEEELVADVAAEPKPDLVGLEDQPENPGEDNQPVSELIPSRLEAGRHPDPEAEMPIQESSPSPVSPTAEPAVNGSLKPRIRREMQAI